MILSWPEIQVRSNCLILYTACDYGGNLRPTHLKKLYQSLKIARQTTYSGELRTGTKKRLTRCIDLLVQTTKTRHQWNPVTQRETQHRLSFITLTIHQGRNLTAQEAYKKVFVHFIQWMRRTMKVKTYVWKAEFQKRGQIHYHITTPSFIHYQEIRDKWNNLQQQAGLLAEYYAKKGHYDPNSTDIHSVKHVKNLSSYLKKEFAKCIQNQKTTGKVWDCSQNLKSSRYFTLEVTPEQEKALLRLDDQKKIGEITLDQCTVFTGKTEDLLQVLGIKDIKNYDDHLTAIRNKEFKEIPKRKVVRNKKKSELSTGVH